MPSAADEHLLTLIQAGDRAGWQQFIDRFQRRLLAFAHARTGEHATAEDLVQDTFVCFLRSMNQYRQESELETFLFQILRRRIVDFYRSKGSSREILACSLSERFRDSLSLEPTTLETPPGIVINEEDSQRTRTHLGSAIRDVTERLREQQRFRDLKIAEGIFYAGIKNQVLASKVGCTADEVALVKHRLIQRISRVIESPSFKQAAGAIPLREDLLSQAWEDQRPSCPKRTTLGKYVLGLLSADWTDYVCFHAETLGCIFCNANLDELGDLNLNTEVSNLSGRLFQSTIGFFTAKPCHPN